MLGNALMIGFALFLVRFVALEAVFQRARRRGSSVHFPVGIGLRIICRQGGPFLILVGYKMAQQASSRFDQATAILVPPMGVACLLTEPGEIITTTDGLVQKSAWA